MQECSLSPNADGRNRRQRADRRFLPTLSSIAVLFVDRDNPAPDAQWRKRIADATARIRADEALFVLCAGSPLIRGVLTAINWIHPSARPLRHLPSTRCARFRPVPAGPALVAWIRAPKYETKIVANVDAALASIAERRASALPIARRMLDELRDESRRAIRPRV